MGMRRMGRRGKGRGRGRRGLREDDMITTDCEDRRFGWISCLEHLERFDV